MNNNDPDIRLLNFDPEKLVLKYLQVIESLVMKKLIWPGYFLNRDKNDITQEIIKGLIIDIDKISKNYNGYSKFSSYFIQIIKNRCYEILRNEYKQETREILNDNPDNPGFIKKTVYFKKFTHVENDLENVLVTSKDADRNLIIESELEVLDIVIRMYSLSQAKLLICLKVLAGIEISIRDLKAFNNNSEQRIYEAIIDFTRLGNKHSNEDCYLVLTEFFNSCDKTNKKKDAIRKWVKKMLEDIIYQMNRNASPPVYNRENIMGLFVWYFDWKQKNIS